MFKVITIVGTRPEIVKLSRVIAELDRHVKHVLVHTGQNFDYELNEIFFQQLEVESPTISWKLPGRRLPRPSVTSSPRPTRSWPESSLMPCCFSAIPTAALAVIAAKRRKIPIFHMEAGNRCFDQRVPEETNRKIIDHTSDINIVFSEHARRYLLAEGIRPETVIKTGSPMKEVLAYYQPKIEASEILDELKLAPERYFVVSAHREENIDSERNFADLLESLNAIARRYEMPVIVSTHPRTRKRLETLNLTGLDQRIRFIKPLGFLDYVKLQQYARCVISDSGTITEESSILGFPAITIRQAHERPEGMDEATLIMSGLQPETVLKSIEVAVAHYVDGGRPFRLLPDYDTDNVSRKVLRIILSYTEYVNRTVWFKPESGE